MKRTLFINGHIHTMAREGDKAQAMAVCGHCIEATGSNEAIGALPADEVVDLGGNTVLPGFIDTHMHAGMYAGSLAMADLRGAASIGELLSTLLSKAEQTPPGQWVLGAGFDQERLKEKRFPTRLELDGVSTEHPIFISRCCLHSHVANSMALRLAGITGETAAQIAGTVATDAAGQPTGLLLEYAAQPVQRHIPLAPADRGQSLRQLKAICREFSSVGITSATTIAVADIAENFGLYQDLAKSGQLTVRFNIATDKLPPCGIQTGLGDDMVKYGFFKKVCDGALGSRTAALYAPYADDESTSGILNYTQERLNDIVETAHNAGLQVGLHAIGDRGLDAVLTAIENAWQKNPRPDPRFRVIHASVVNEELLTRMARLPLLVDVQPKFLSSDMAWIESRLGQQRAAQAFRFRTMTDRGLLLCGGSDLPVEPCNPFLGIAAAVTRQTLEGWPRGGWHPEERLSVYEAVALYTRNAAYASFEENRKGTLEAGKLADFQVLDRDPFAIEAHMIAHTVVEQTYLDGRPVYTSS